jgi:glutamate 5-kinase
MKRIVVKLGTGVLTSPHGRSLDTHQFRRLTTEISELRKTGHQCIIVSSGAVTAGIVEFGLDRRPTQLDLKQACAAVGQPRLMRAFDSNFKTHGFRSAQLLLTHDDIDSRRRRANAKRTLETLLAVETLIPIINENDSVATEELSLGDNDRLSAEVALLAGADLLVILTSSDGLLDAAGVRIPRIDRIESALAFVRPEKGENSVGGMGAKLAAVQIAVNGGIETVIADGRKPGQIPGAAGGEDVGTRFAVQKRATGSKKRRVAG